MILYRYAVGMQVSVETKDGGIYTGLLLMVDKHLNLDLGDVILKGGENHHRVFLKGTAINAIRMSEKVMQQYKVNKEKVTKEIE